MSLMRSRYKELGLDLVEPLQDHPHKPQRPSMVEEKKDEGAGHPIKILLEEALEKYRSTKIYKNKNKHRDVVETKLHFINMI